jgi:eukaryotic-like serine/threonine-protein kinase
VLNGPIPRPSRFALHLSPEVDAVLLKALQRNPDDRYATAVDFAEALDGLKLEHSTMRAVATHVESNFAEKLAERRKLIREAPEHEPDPASMDGNALRSHVRTTGGSNPSAAPSSPDHTSAGNSSENATPTLTVQEIEHRRLRGVLAAVMLLLVGSAVGLLVARQNVGVAPAPAAAPSAPSIQPAPAPAEPVRSP